MMFRSLKKENQIQPQVNIVILNFALDTRSIFSRIYKNIYTFFKTFGQLNDAKLYDVVALSEKISTDPDYIQLLISKYPLTENEKLDLKMYQEIKTSIQEASKIYIMGHCSQGYSYLFSNSEVVTPMHSIKHYFPKNMKNKNVDIIACESNTFTELLAEDLQYQTEGPHKINCNGMTLSSKTYITLPLPNGECYYFKMTESGLPHIFKTGKNYRKDFLITNDDVIAFDISNESDAADFQTQVEGYRISQEEKSRFIAT